MSNGNGPPPGPVTPPPVTITEDDVEFEVSVLKLRPDPTTGAPRPTVLKYIQGDLPRSLELLFDGIRIVAKLLAQGSTQPVEKSRIVSPHDLPPIPIDPRFRRKL